MAARDIVIGSLHTEYSSFGSWQLIAIKHHEAVRFRWDGRDGYLTVAGSPMPDSRTQKEWREEVVKGFDRVAGDDPQLFVDQYLTKRFPI